MTPGTLLQPCPAYTCTGCSRDMVVLVGDAPAADRCHRCRMMPGWHKRPEVVALCDFDERLLGVPATCGGVGHA